MTWKDFYRNIKGKNVKVNQIGVLIIHIHEGREREEEMRQTGHMDLRSLNLNLTAELGVAACTASRF